MLRNRILLSALASTALVTAASAADLGTSVPLPAPPAVFTWSGIYLGVNVAGAFSNNDKTNYKYTNPNECGDAASCNTPNPTPTITQLLFGSSDHSNIMGGAQIGYNWQFSSLVLGVEASFDIGGTHKQRGFFSKENCEGAGYSPNGCVAFNENVFGYDAYDHFLSSISEGNSFGTLRGRLGWAWDRALIYATGGLAWGGSNSASIQDYRLVNGPTRLSSYSGIPVDVFTSTDHGTGVGFAVGGGLEYAFLGNWSIKAEYLYVDLDRGGKTQFQEAAGPDFGPGIGNIGNITASNRHDTFSVVTVGLNYKFGAPAPAPAPVIAAY
jgi:outer membrane immunogenic protein